MANPAADYPEQLHDPTDISAKASSALGSTPKKHSEVHGKIEQEILEVQKKLGLGESNASDATEDQVLTINADGSTEWKDPQGGAQTYDEYIFNSSGIQENNRYNDWADLYAAGIAGGQHGIIRVTFEQNETLPAGTYNLDNVIFNGNGSIAALGGLVVTLPQGFEVSSWVNAALDGGVGLLYQGDTPLLTYSSGINLFNMLLGNGVQTTTAPFFDIKGNATVVIRAATGSTIANGGYEPVQITETPFFIYIAGGSNTSLDNNVFRGDFGDANGLIGIDSPASAINPTRTDANLLNGPMPISLFSRAIQVSYDNGASGLSAATVQAALDEIAALPGGGGVWGAITGDILDQTDLQDQFSAVDDDITALEAEVAKQMTLIGTYSFGSDNINFYDGSPNTAIGSYSASLGDVLRVRTGGSKNFGSGTIYGEENDLLYYDNTQWKLIKNFTMTIGALTANSLLATGGSTNQLQSLNPASYPSLTEISYVKGSTSGIQTQLNGKIATTQKGAANGVAELDAGGLVPSSQLPSYVDDVLEYANFAALPVFGETGKIYITIDDNKTYRWSGSLYVEISASLALGETSSTAYRGDRGKIAYDHSQDVTTNPHAVTKTQVGLSNVTNDAQIPLSYLDTDGVLAANSDTKVASQKAVNTKIYAKTAVIKPTSGDWYSMGGQSGAGSPGMTSAGKIIFHPMLLDIGTLDRIAVSSSVAAVSTWRLGLYKADPATGLPDGMIPFLDAGTVDMNSSPGVQAITISQAITEAGLYWAAALVDAYTAQPTTHNVQYSSNSGGGIHGLPQDMSSFGRYRVGRTHGSAVATGSLPTAPTSSMSWAGVVPRIAVRYT